MWHTWARSAHKCTIEWVLSPWGQNFVIVFLKLWMAADELFLNLAISNKNKVPFKYFKILDQTKKMQWHITFKNGFTHAFCDKLSFSKIRLLLYGTLWKSQNFDFFILRNIFLNSLTFLWCLKKIYFYYFWLILGPWRNFTLLCPICDELLPQKIFVT